MQEWFQALFAGWFGAAGNDIGLLVSIVVKIVIILVPLILTVAYLTYFERKVIGFMQLRVGPNVTGPWGLIQPFADVLKLLFKEVTRPSSSNKALFYIGPMLSLAPSFAAWAVVPFSDQWLLTKVDAGLLYILMIASLSVYGVIIAGWASNSKYAFLGAMRSSAQTISYEIAMSAALVCVIMVSGSLLLGLERVFVEFLHFGFDAFLLQARQVLHENFAVEVVDFVLDADAEQAFGFGFAACAAEVVVGVADGFRAFDVGKLAGQ